MHGISVYRALVVGLLLLGGHLAPSVQARIPIEQAQREFQARYYYRTGEYAAWPGCPCSEEPPPHFPMDEFYGDEVENPVFAVELVEDLIDKVYQHLSGSLSGYVEPVIVGVTDLELPGIAPPADLRPVTVENYPEQLAFLLEYLLRLTHLAVPGGWIGEGTPTNASPLLTRHIDLTGPLAEGSGCSEMQEHLLALYAADPGTLGGLRPGSEAGVRIFRNGDRDRVNWGYSVVAGRMVADLSGYGRYPGTATAYVRVEPEGSGFGTSHPPGGGQPGAWALLESGVEPGAFYGSSVIPGEEGDPPVLPADCTEGRQGWSLHGATVVIEPEFETEPDLEISCAELCCPSCQGGACDLGRVKPELGSVRVRIGLGEGTHGEGAGFIYLSVPSLGPGLGSPRALRTAVNGVEVISNSNGLRQVSAPRGWADIQVLSEDRYDIRFFHAMDRGPVSNGLYTIAAEAEPISVITVSNQYQAALGHRLVIREALAGSFTDYVFAQMQEGGEITLATRSAEVERLESVHTEWIVPDRQRTETHTVLDAQGQHLLKRVREYTVFPWGEELTREIVDPEDRALVTTYAYYDDRAAEGGTYGQLRQRVDSNGYWERYAYDAYGRPAGTVARFLDALFDAPASQCRETRVAYGVEDGDAVVTTSEWLLGQEIARTHRRYGAGYTSVIRCEIPGAPPDTPAALVTTTIEMTGGRLDGEPARIDHPDGTIDLYTYGYPTAGRLTRRSTGAPSEDGQEVVDGVRMDSIVNDVGTTVLVETRDLPTGQVLSRQEVVEMDAFGRALHTDYLDGTRVSTTYSCCGPETVTDRDGVVTTYVRDGVGRVVETSRAGITTRVTYDELGRIRHTLRRGTDHSELPQGGTDYSPAGEVVSVTDGLGQVTSLSSYRDGDHRVRTTTYPDGGTEIREFFGDGSLYELRGSAVSPVRYAYGVSNLVHDGRTIPSTFTQTLALTGSGALAGPYRTEFRDMLGRLIRTEHADGSAIQDFYNGKGQRVRNVSETGITTLYAYNPAGELEDTSIDMNGNGAIDYDGADLISRSESSVVYAHGEHVLQKRTYAWTSLDDASSRQERVRQDSALDGSETWQIRDGLETHHRQDFLAGGGRRQVVTTPDLVQTSSRWLDGFLVEIAHTNSAGEQLSRTAYAYDAHGRLATITDDAAGSTSYAYDGLDRVIATTFPAAGPGQSPVTITYVYDEMGRLIEQHGPAGGMTNTYFATGALRRRQGAHTYPVEFAYDAQSRPISLTTWRRFEQDEGRAQTRWIHDPLRGFQVAKQYSGGEQVGYTHAADGRLASRRWARGATVDFDYEPAGRLRLVDYDDDTPDIIYGYDRMGRIASVDDAAGMRAYGYTTGGILTNESVDSGPLAGFRLQRTADALGRPAALALVRPDGQPIHTVRYAYDPASRLASVSGADLVARYDYLPNSGRIATTTYHTGSADVLRVSRQVDGLHRLTELSAERLPEPDLVGRHAYTYDPAGLRSRMDQWDGSHWEYEYDALGQLISAMRRHPDGRDIPGQAHSFAYDTVGNRTLSSAHGAPTTYLAGPLNQYSQRNHPGVVDLMGTADTGTVVTVNSMPSARDGAYFHHQLALNVETSHVYATLRVTAVKPGAGPAGEDVVAETIGRRFVPQSPESFSFDADGNLLVDGRWTYHWNGANRLVAMETRDDLHPDVPRLRLDFTYDHLGRRVSKKVTELPSGTVQTHLYFLYDGWHLLAELDALQALAPVRTYTWGLDASHTVQGAGGIGGLLAVHLHAGSESQTLIPVFDGSGNLIRALGAESGDVNATFEYSPFGRLTRRSGPRANQLPFGFSTKYRDSETGLLYFGHRYLNPTTGRWISRDPAGESQGPNLYQFVANNPTLYLDPLGLALYAFDGTGQDYGSWTHVSILHRSYQGSKYYANGVGSGPGTKVIGGLTGLGGRSRLDEMYQNLVNSFKAGDREIDIIGFSRGASLAREFANMIYERGVVETRYEHDHSHGYFGEFRGRPRTTVLDCDPDIRFVGLFDTVGSFGVPGNDINLRIQMDLPPNVRNAAQAIAGDERRGTFPLTPLNQAANGQRFSQHVFPGDHSDIGGGHGADQNALALAPLIYIHSQGVTSGVPFGPLRLTKENGGLYLRVGGERRPWPYRLSREPHDLTKSLLFRDGGVRQNLPTNH